MGSPRRLTDTHEAADDDRCPGCPHDRASHVRGSLAAIDRCAAALVAARARCVLAAELEERAVDALRLRTGAGPEA